MVPLFPRRSSVVSAAVVVMQGRMLCAIGPCSAPVRIPYPLQPLPRLLLSLLTIPIPRASLPAPPLPEPDGVQAPLASARRSQVKIQEAVQDR